MTDKNNKTIKLLESSDVQLIDNRFRVKLSSFDNGVDKKSILLVIHDLLKNNFNMTFYNTTDEAAQMISLLKLVKD